MTDPSNIVINIHNYDSSGNNIRLLEEKRIRHVLSLRNVVMRQTEYDSEKALEKLKEFNGDVLAIVREYMGTSKNELERPPKSTNQAIMTEIRNMMDDASTKYRIKKELEEKRKLMIEKVIEQKQKET